MYKSFSFFFYRFNDLYIAIGIILYYHVHIFFFFYRFNDLYIAISIILYYHVHIFFFFTGLTTLSYFIFCVTYFYYIADWHDRFPPRTRSVPTSYTRNISGFFFSYMAFSFARLKNAACILDYVCYDIIFLDQCNQRKRQSRKKNVTNGIFS